MRKITKIAAGIISLAGIFTNYAIADEKSLVDYLNNKNVSFLIVNSDNNSKMTTFGWHDAAETCKILKTDGFYVETVRNYDAKTNNMTNSVCE